MIVYAVIYTVGLSSGFKELIGVCSSIDRAETIKRADMKRHCRNEWHYSIQPIEINRTVYKVYQEW